MSKRDPRAKRPIDADRIVATTAAEAARFFNIHRSTIGDWLDKGMPGRRATDSAPAHFCLSAMFQWRRAMTRIEGGEPPGRVVGDILAARCFHDCGCGFHDAACWPRNDSPFAINEPTSGERPAKSKPARRSRKTKSPKRKV